jgi:Fungal tRNA ligase phosphodiesterase domain
MSKIIYSALFVDDINALKRMFAPVFQNVFYHHSTIEFAPKDATNIEVGKKVELQVIGRITTDRVDALLVNNTKSKNKHPHITLSTANGVKPVESNDAFELEPTKLRMFNQPFTIATTEGYYADNKEVKS